MSASPRGGRRHPLRRVEAGLSAVGKYLGLFSTAMKLVQLAPAAVGLAIVFFSPTAWLSGTLRAWSLGGVVVGTALGLATLAALAPRLEHRDRVGLGALTVAAACAAILRFHLALVDLEFLARWSFLQPLHDFYLGSDLGERLYNASAALWFALALGFATLGLPTFVRGRAERRTAESAPPSPDGDVRTALTTLTAAVDRLERANAELRAENARLRAAEGAASGGARTERASAGPAAARGDVTP